MIAPLTASPGFVHIAQAGAMPAGGALPQAPPPHRLILQLHFMRVFFDEPSPLGPDAIGARVTMPG